MRLSDALDILNTILFLGLIVFVVTGTAGYLFYYRANGLHSSISQSTLGTSTTLERKRCAWVEDIKHLDTGEEQLFCHVENDSDAVSDLPILGEPIPGIQLTKPKGPNEKTRTDGDNNHE